MSIYSFFCFLSSKILHVSKYSLISLASTNININKNSNDIINDNCILCDDKNTINKIINVLNQVELNNARTFLGNLGCNLGPYTAKNKASIAYNKGFSNNCLII